MGAAMREYGWEPWHIVLFVGLLIVGVWMLMDILEKK